MGELMKEKRIDELCGTKANKRNEISLDCLPRRAASPTTNQQSNQLLSLSEAIDGVDWWSCAIHELSFLLSFLELVGYGRWHRQWLRQEEKTKTKRKGRNEWSRKREKVAQFVFAAVNQSFMKWKLIDGANGRQTSGEPSASAVSEINQFFFCGPAVRPQKEDEIDWGAMCWPQAVNSIDFINWRALRNKPTLFFNHQHKAKKFAFVEEKKELVVAAPLLHFPSFIHSIWFHGVEWNQMVNEEKKFNVFNLRSWLVKLIDESN